MIEVLRQDLSLFLEPFATEEQMLNSLSGSARAERGVCFAQPKQVGFVIAVAEFQLKKGRGNFPRGVCRKREGVWCFQLELGSVGPGVWFGR